MRLAFWLAYDGLMLGILIFEVELIWRLVR